MRNRRLPRLTSAVLSYFSMSLLTVLSSVATAAPSSGTGVGDCPCGVVPRGGCPSSTAESSAPGERPASELQLDETYAAMTGSSFAVSDGPGYIDYAVVRNFFRIRFDAAYNDRFADRAEFIYPQCGCFNGLTPPPSPLAKGPPKPESRVDYQDLTPYVELVLLPGLSGFIETPVRFLNPEQNDNAAGFSDIITGFKYALVAHDDTYLTFQFKIYAPTGDPHQGLGTGHASLEPGLLLYQRWTDRLSLYGELRDWIPLSDANFAGHDFAGNVFRYGIGFGYDLLNSDSCCQTRRLAAITELVGWSVLGGQESNQTNVFDATGDSILNAKVGLRYTMNEHSFYLGYGHALTSQAWYEDIMRLEYRLAF